MLCENADEPLQKNYTISFNNLLEAVHWTLGSWKSLGLFELPTQMDKWQFPKPEPRTEVKAIRWQRRFNQARFRQRFSAALQEPECFVAGCRLMVKVKQQTDETNKDDEQQSCWGHTRGLLSWFTPDLSVQSGGEPWFEVWLCVCFFCCFFFQIAWSSPNPSYPDCVTRRVFASHLHHMWMSQWILLKPAREEHTHLNIVTTPCSPCRELIGRMKSTSGHHFSTWWLINDHQADFFLSLSSTQTFCFCSFIFSRNATLPSNSLSRCSLIFLRRHTL